MTSSSTTYPPELRAQAVWMTYNGWTIGEASDELGPSRQSIANWRHNASALPAFSPTPALLAESARRTGKTYDEGKTSEVNDDVDEASPASNGLATIPEANGSALPAVPEPAALPVPATTPAQLVSVADLIDAEQRATRAETALEAAEARIAELEADRERMTRDHREALRVAGEATKAERERADAAIEAERQRSEVFAQTIGYLAPQAATV